MAYSLERKLLDAQETSARRKRMKKESTEVRQLWTIFPCVYNLHCVR